MTTVTTAHRRRPAERTAPAAESDFRRRLLDGLAACIAKVGYRDTTVADVVRCARTSRRTFYEHFSSREDCLVALLAKQTAEMIRGITAAVDSDAPWETQVRQAVEAWIAGSEAEPALTLSWIRDAPALGAEARHLQREAMEAFVGMIQTLCDTEEWRAHGGAPVSRQQAVMLIGGLRELIASTVEDGGRISDIAEVAVRGSIALVGPR